MRSGRHGGGVVGQVVGGEVAAAATSPDPSASLEAEKARVIAAYQAYTQAMIRLFAGGKADRKILQGTATPEAALHDARQAYLMFSTGGRMVGTPITTRILPVAESQAIVVPRT